MAKYKVRKDSYKSEEITLLIEIYVDNTKEYIKGAFEQRGFIRSWASIYHTAKLLGLKRNPDIIKQEMIDSGSKAPTPKNILLWTEKENDALRQNYPNNSRETILPLFPNRTWKAIREHCTQLGLQRSNEEIVKDRKKCFKENLGVESSWQLPGVREKSRQTNLARRGVEYPTQSAEVRAKGKKTVQERYNVDNVFQAEEIKQKIKTTNIRIYGHENPNQSPEFREKTRQTNQDRYGIDNTFQLTDRVKAGMVKKYGEEYPQRVPEIKKRTIQTNMERYGFPIPSQNSQIRKKMIESLNSDEVKEKKYKTLKNNSKFPSSGEEDAFYACLKNLYPDAEHHILHPVIKSVIDFYLPVQNLWMQYDGGYWHGLTLKNLEGPQSVNIQKTVNRDQIQNENIPNLIRVISGEFKEAKKNNTTDVFIKEIVEEKIEELKKLPPVCHQYKKKIQYYGNDIKQLPFNHDSLKASHFNLAVEGLSDEIVSFIEKYEWLGTIGVTPKWCFTARYQGFLGGVVLINEPVAYSKILGEDTAKYEALIQRGASASWTPTNLGSRLIMFACRWMVNNTLKRVFVGYADLGANERGIIYRACNFDYLGDNFGVSEVLKHPLFKNLFTAHNLKRTSIFIKWCRENNITIEKIWFKKNGFKNIETIPPEIKKAWYSWGDKIVSEAEHVKVDKKMKFALILGKDRRETKKLKDMRAYVFQPYPDTKITQHVVPMTKQIILGKTRNRKNTAKEQFIIDNYGKKTRKELAEQMGESLRWVKRILSQLMVQGKIIKKNP